MTPPGPAAPPARAQPLEALRGVAALAVLLGHVLWAGPALDPHYRPSGPWLLVPPGHLSVLVFFMLSGYVIGLTNAAPLATGPARWHYLRKRLVRLYPLYLVALALTAAVSAGYYAAASGREVAGWLTFLQGLAVAVPARNPPLWSLPYELGYYVLFMLVSARRWRAGWVAAAGLLLGLAGTALRVQPVALVAVAYGAVFWFAGLALARRPARSGPPPYGNMLAFLLLFLCYQRLNLGYTLLQAAHLDLDERQFSYFERPIVFSHLSALLLGGPLLASFAQRTLPGQRWLTLAAFAVPGLYLLGYGATGHLATPRVGSPVLLAAVLYALAAAAGLARHWLRPVGEAVLRRLAPLGGISYGIYIIHYPLLCLAHQVPGFSGTAATFSGTAATFAGRLVAYLAVVLAVSWLLERRWQPWLRRWLLPAGPQAGR